MENRTDFFKGTHHHSSGTNKIAVGVVLIALGFLLVIERTGLLPGYLENILFSWQMLLIAIGFVMTVVLTFLFLNFSKSITYETKLIYYVVLLAAFTGIGKLLESNTLER